MITAKRTPPRDLSHIRAQPTIRGFVRTGWAMILGGAECVWDDVAAWEAIVGRWDGLYIAVNDIGVHWPHGLDHWVTCHAPKLAGWQQLREANVHPKAYATWGAYDGDPVDYVVHRWAAGSSGLLAVQVALELGCTKIVLCGMPMQPTPHFAESAEFDAQNTAWKDAEQYWRGWLRVNERGWFDDKVRSMSGRTRDLFGTPTREWLHVP